MKIIALDVCWNSRYGQLNTEQELLYQQAVSNKVKNVCLGFRGKLSLIFHNAIHH